MFTMRKVVGSAIAVLVAGVIAGGGGPAPDVVAVTLKPAPMTFPVLDVAEPEVPPVTFAAVGDSITAWNDYAGVNQLTWPVATGADTVLVGGWAKGGANLALMAANVQPVDADVLVIMAGTNDLGDRWGTPMESRLQSIRSIAAAVGAPRVILSAVAPMDGHLPWVTAHNTALRDLAATEGWTFVDPWEPITATNGNYAEGATTDGVHPTWVAAQIIGDTLGSAITQSGR